MVIKDESFVLGSSFNDGYNVGIGVFGTNNLTLKDNVIHHTVGPAVDLGGQYNKLIHNLVMMSLAEATFKVMKCLKCMDISGNFCLGIGIQPKFKNNTVSNLFREHVVIMAVSGG